MIGSTIVIHHDAAGTDGFDEIVLDHRRTNDGIHDMNAVARHADDAVAKNLATIQTGLVKAEGEDNSVRPLSGFCRRDMVGFYTRVVRSYDDPGATRVNFVFPHIESRAGKHPAKHVDAGPVAAHDQISSEPRLKRVNAYAVEADAAPRAIERVIQNRQIGGQEPYFRCNSNRFRLLFQFRRSRHCEPSDAYRAKNEILANQHTDQYASEADRGQGAFKDADSRQRVALQSDR